MTNQSASIVALPKRQQTKNVAVTMACIAVVAVALFSPSLAWSAGGLSGGLDTAKTQVTAIRTALYAIVGIGAGLYLLWQAVLCWNGKKDWSDMVPAIIHVAIAGGAITLATWAWETLA